jgi:hypothetical protein
MRWQIILLVIAGMATTLFVARIYSAFRWRTGTKRIHAQLDASSRPIDPKTFDSKEIEGLPAPVRRYFRTVLKEGQLLVAAVSVEHAGSFNVSGTGEQWKPFKSTQRVITQRPGFVWDACIRVAPAMAVYVRDAYTAGEGALTAKLLGLFTVMEQPSTPELAQGELMRFLAEGAWYPTALLPSQGLVWEAIDEKHAGATLTDGTTTVKLVFQFDAQGLISSVRSDGRYREVDGRQVATPWQGLFWNYEVRNGLLIPLEGEASWLLPDRLKPYWRGRITTIEYRLAG